MRVAAGTRLGPYDIIAPIGEGGMGEVYRARDARLKRDVAIKLLPSYFSTDEERVARFTREAQMLAALNHPHIASIYGVEDTSEGRALVMEFVDGRTLADRLQQRPVPIDEALTIARQIADALEAAHEKGIIHRDLKPANIAFTAEGDVKVLDFGLAKAMEPETAGDPSLSPTLTLRATQAGLILGTAAYMSPEQARGRAADKRTDVWAFGCVLFEMLTGRRAFEGEDVTDVIAAVVRAEPDWTALPGGVPPQIELLMRRCLVKERKQRISDIGVARFLMAETLAAPPAVTAAAATASPPDRSPRRRTVLTAAAALVAGAALTAAGSYLADRGRPVARPQPMRFTMLLPQPITAQGVDRDIAISPDGTRIVYRAGSGQAHLVVRAIDQLEAQPLSATSGARQPFFSPDGRWVGFVSGNELKKVAVDGGPAITICRVPGVPRGATWAEDDTIVFASGDATIGLQRVSAGGGEIAAVTTPDRGDHNYPSALPASRGVLFAVAPAVGTASGERSIAVLDQRSGQWKTIIRGGTDATYVRSGHIVYAAAGALRAIRFDLERLETSGVPVPVVDQVSTTTLGAANYTISATGTLLYVPGAGSGDITAQRTLVWVDRAGREEPIAAPPRAYFKARLSPDASRIALEITDQEHDIWVWEIARRILTRLTFTPGVDSYPVWTPDSRRVIFTSSRAGAPNLYWRLADGSGADQRLTTSDYPQNALSVTPDGAVLLAFENAAKTGPNIVSLTLSNATSGGGRAQTMVETDAIEWTAEVSPNGRWLAYASNESGQFEIIVRPYPDLERGRWQVSSGGGTKPVWSRDGRELFYLDATNNLLAVSVDITQPIFISGNATKIVDGRYFHGAPPVRSYDVSPDGRRFLMINTAGGEQTTMPSRVVVVINWLEEVARRTANVD